VGADPVVAAVEHGPQLQRPFEVAERAFGLDELLVARATSSADSTGSLL
jgi:hypothetical protein